MTTMKDLADAPLFTVFRGPVGEDSKLRIDEWELFAVDRPNDEVMAEAARRGIMATNFEPEVDDEAMSSREGEKPDDSFAWLAFLQEGGTLVKLPHELPHPFSTPGDIGGRWSYYAVFRVAGAAAGKCLPEETCVYCGDLCEGSFAIHKSRDMEGEEVPLCTACGGAKTPTCDEIWDKIEHYEGTKT